MSDLFTYNPPTAVSEAGRAGQMMAAKPPFKLVFLCLLVGLLTPVSLLMSFNFFNDRSGVFHEDRNFTKQTNLNFVRMKYLLEHGNQHRVILFGTSRANALDLRAHVDETAYILGTLGGVIQYHLTNLERLIDSGIVPDRVLLGLGEAAIKLPPVPIWEQEQEVRLYPPSGAIAAARYYLDYLLFIPGERDFSLFLNLIKSSRGGVEGQSETSRAFLRTGRFYCFECEDRALKRSDAEHAAVLARATQRMRGHPSKRSSYGVSEAISDVKRFIRLAYANDIEVFVFVDPIYQDLYLQDDMQSWLRFKRELSQITPFLDFSNFDPTFAEPRNFIDPVHYDRETGARMMESIASALEGRVDALDLGTWVTAENVEAHLRQQLQSYLSLQH